MTNTNTQAIPPQEVVDACYAYVASLPSGELGHWPTAADHIFPECSIGDEDYWLVYRAFTILEGQGKIAYLSHRGWYVPVRAGGVTGQGEKEVLGDG